MTLLISKGPQNLKDLSGEGSLKACKPTSYEWLRRIKDAES